MVHLVLMATGPWANACDKLALVEIKTLFHLRPYFAVLAVGLVCLIAISCLVLPLLSNLRAIVWSLCPPSFAPFVLFEQTQRLMAMCADLTTRFLCCQYVYT